MVSLENWTAPKTQDTIYHVSRGSCGNGRGDRGGYGAQDNGCVAAGVSPGSGVRGGVGVIGYGEGKGYVG